MCCCLLREKFLLDYATTKLQAQLKCNEQILRELRDMNDTWKGWMSA